MKFKKKFSGFVLVTIIFDKDNFFQSLIIPKEAKYFIVHEKWEI